MQNTTYYSERLGQLLDEARNDGVVIEVRLVALEPLAMGRYVMEPHVREHQKGQNFGQTFPALPPWPVAKKSKKGSK